MNKYEMHQFVVAGLFRETFTSVDLPFVVDITKHREMIMRNPKRWPIMRLSLTDAVVEFLHQMREIDPDRLTKLTGSQLLDPAFVTTFPDGSAGICPIDGHHRLVRLHQCGIAEALVYVIPWQELQQAEIGHTVAPTWGNKQVDLKTGKWIHAVQPSKE